MKIIKVTQGSQEWLEYRRNALNASDAPAMMGCSPYKTRAQLIQEMATGVVAEVDAATQKRFDAGHAIEAATRACAEVIIGQELYQMVGSDEVSGLTLSASFDGLTAGDEVNWECKSLNDDLRAALAPDINANDCRNLPLHYLVQCEQQMMVSGAGKTLFSAANAAGDDVRHCWVYPNAELRSKIVSGWKLLLDDAKAYKPTPAAVDVVAPPIESLPVPFVEMIGQITKTNLADFKRVALERIGAVKTDLVTDTDFAEAEAMVKFLDDAEGRIDVVKEQALGQAQSIQEFFKTLDDIKAQMRAKRLEVNKLVTRRKEERRVEIVASGRARYTEHVAAINERLGRMILTRQSCPEPNFADAIKGKRNFQSMQDAVDALLANAKVDANAIADKVDANLKHFAAEAVGYEGLFRDLDALLFKPADDFALVVKTRIADHKAAEQKRLDDERERIRKEEEAKATAKAAEEVRAQVAAQAVAPQAQLAPAPSEPPGTRGNPLPTGVSTNPHKVVTMARDTRPSDEAIIAALALHYRVHESKVIAWLLAMDLDAASKRMASEFDAA